MLNFKPCALGSHEPTAMCCYAIHPRLLEICVSFHWKLVSNGQIKLNKQPLSLVHVPCVQQKLVQTKKRLVKLDDGVKFKLRSTALI